MKELLEKIKKEIEMLSEYNNINKDSLFAIIDNHIKELEYKPISKYYVA